MWQNKFIERFDKHNGSWQISLQLENSLNNWVNSVNQPNETDFADFCFEKSNLLNLYSLLFFSVALFLVNINVWLLLQWQRLLFKDSQLLTQEIIKNMATQHLFAYLENIGWDTSKKIHNKITKEIANLHSNITHTSAEDIFQIFWEKQANNPIVFYQNYNPTLGTLVNYTNSKIKSIIKDNVFDNPLDTHTGYGLLKKLDSEVKKREALQRQGYKKTDVMFDNYITIWKLFNEVCKGHKKAPRSEHWQGLTKLYNQDNQVLIKEELIRDWINNICIPAAKNYLSIRIQPNSPGQDILEQLRSDNNMPEYILEQEQYNDIINNFIGDPQDLPNTNFTLEERQVMFLLYGFNLNQTEIAKQLGWYSTKNNQPQQFKVSRCTTKIFKKLTQSYIDAIRDNQNQLEWLNLDVQLHLNSEIINLAKNYFEPMLAKQNSSFMKELVKQAENQMGNQNECISLEQRQRQLKIKITNIIDQKFGIYLLDSNTLLSKIDELISDYDS